RAGAATDRHDDRSLRADAHQWVSRHPESLVRVSSEPSPTPPMRLIVPKARPRVTTAVAASLASLMLLTACGGDSDSDSSGTESSESAASEAGNTGSPELAEPTEEDLATVE